MIALVSMIWGKETKKLRNSRVDERMCVQMFMTQAAAIYNNLFERKKKEETKCTVRVRWIGVAILTRPHLRGSYKT